MKPETEVKTSLNILYDAVFSGGNDQLVVKQASEDSYAIVLRATAAIVCSQRSLNGLHYRLAVGPGIPDESSI